MKLKNNFRLLKLQICFHTLKILTFHVISEIDQHYQLYWVFLNYYTLVISIICEIDQHYQLYWVLLNYYTLVSIICDKTKFRISKPVLAD